MVVSSSSSSSSLLFLLCVVQAHYNDPQSDDISRVRGQLNEVSGVMMDNIGGSFSRHVFMAWRHVSLSERVRACASSPMLMLLCFSCFFVADKVLERGVRLEDMADKTQTLREQGSQFSRNATSLKRHFCLRNAKMTFILVVICLVCKPLLPCPVARVSCCSSSLSLLLDIQLFLLSI